MDIAGVAISIVAYICPASHFVQSCSRMRSLKKEAKKMERKMKELKSRENDIRSELDIAQLTKARTPKNEVQLWLDNVVKIKAEVTVIEDEVKKEIMKCIPNCLSRLRLGKAISKKIKLIEEYMVNGRFLDGLSLDSSVTNGIVLSATPLIVKTTAKRTMEMIWECLADIKIRKIGVYGMGGIGKTTIMMHVNNQLVDSQMFDHVIWVTASNALKLEKLQCDIAKALKLELLTDDDDEISRAAKLLNNFSRRKKFVLILDDIWKAYPLHKIGIPEPTILNGSKIILTTRSLDVCRGMETQKIIKMDLLSEVESWDLFREKVGHHVKLEPEVEVIAKLVADKCSCLPLAVITVGAAMREVVDIREWRNALHELGGSTAEVNGIVKEVFECLKFSFRRLRNHAIKECFLYLALFPSDHRINPSELVDYWVAEGLIGDGLDRVVAKDKCYAILNELKNVSLIEKVADDNNAEDVKLHDLVRDMAIDVTRTNHHFLVKAGVNLSRSPPEFEWNGDFERVSLMNNNIVMLQGEPNCPKLSTLLLQGNRVLRNISNAFFSHFAHLKVLNLSNTSIEILPESLAELKSLRCLILRDCVNLKELPSLKKMKDLMVLNLHNTAIESVPNIKWLSNLRSLDISNTESLNHVGEGTFACLTLLEELSTLGSNWKWKSRSKDGEATIEEITNSKRLTNLRVQFLDLEALDAYVKSGHWQQLKNFEFHVGRETLNILQVQMNDRTIEIRSCSAAALRRLSLPPVTLELTLRDCNGISHLPESMLQSSNQLRVVSLIRCNEMGHILVGKMPLLERLESMWLWELPSLESICKGALQLRTFANLKSLTVYDCGNMKSLFPRGMLELLHNLQVIEICSCTLMEEIIGADEGGIIDCADDVFVLKSLKTLYLDYLPNLRAICKGVLVCNSLSSLTVDGCPLLKKLPFSASNLPSSIYQINGQRSWWDTLEWDDEEVRTKLMWFPNLNCG